MNLTAELQEIAELSSGVTFREKVAASPSGNVRVIQMRDIDSHNVIQHGQAILVNHPKMKVSQQVRTNDIIFRSRGLDYTAALFQHDPLDNFIIAAPLVRIRPDATRVLPQYLLWWVNHSRTQAFLKSHAMGTAQKMISMATLGSLRVQLPPLPQQGKIVAAYNLAVQEQQLLEQIKNRRMYLTQGILMQAASESRCTAGNRGYMPDTELSATGQPSQSI